MIRLECETKNTISSISYVGRASSPAEVRINDRSCFKYNTKVNMTIVDSCTFAQELETDYKDKCIGKNSCDINLNALNIAKNCETPYNANENKIYFTYSCYAPLIGNGQFNFKRSDFGFFVAGIDILSILVILIGIIVIEKSQKTNLNYFRDEVPQISYFTTRFENLNFNGNKINSEIGELIKHINTVIELETQKKLELNIIYDINYPFFSANILNLYLDKNQLKEKKRKFEERKKENQEKLPTYEKRLERIKTKSETINGMIKKTKDKDSNKVNDIYITFRIQKYSDIITKAYNRGKCSRCCLIFCCQKKKIEHL